jgi:hypothetical protein
MIETLTFEPKKAQDIMNETGLARSTFYEQMKKLTEQGLVVQYDGGYAKSRINPTTEQIVNDINIWLGQRRMDSKFRRIPNFDQIKSAFDWYVMKNPKQQAFANPDQYEDSLINAIGILQRQNQCY